MAEKRDVRLAFCWAHVRRRFYELAAAGPAPIAKPVLDALEPFLGKTLQLIGQKTKLAEAIRYTLSRWEGLCRFIDDGHVKSTTTTPSAPSARSP